MSRLVQIGLCAGGKNEGQPMPSTRRVTAATHLAGLGNLPELFESQALRPALENALILLGVDVERLVVLDVDRNGRLMRRRNGDLNLVLLLVQVVHEFVVIVVVIIVDGERPVGAIGVRAPGRRFNGAVSRALRASRMKVQVRAAVCASVTAGRVMRVHG